MLVVGAGTVGLRRATACCRRLRSVHVVAPLATPALADLAATGRLTWSQRAYADGDLDGAWLVLACTDDPAVNAAGRRRRPSGAGSSAAAPTTRSVGQRGSPPSDAPEPSPWPSMPTATRAVRSRCATSWSRPCWLRDLRRATARARGRVVLVGGGPGDPGLITVRGRAALAEADVVVADRLAPLALLDELRGEVVVIDAAKVPGGHAMAQEEINRLLVEHARAGRFVVRLKGGDPYVFGRGMEEVQACVEAGLTGRGRARGHERGGRARARPGSR